MHLIFGGAYQGKLDYAKERYRLSDRDIFVCGAGEEECPGLSGKCPTPAGNGFQECPAETSIDFSKKAVYRLEEFALGCVLRGEEAAAYLAANREKWQDTVFICADISSGVVPVDPEMRAWREMTGRMLLYMGREAKEVTRMFCGIPQRIK